MTQDEIIEMARQAASHGVENHRSGEVSFVFYNEHLMNFAKLVEDKVRQEIIETIKDLTPRSGHKTPEYLLAKKIINSVGQEVEELDVYTMQMLRQQGINV